MMADACAQGLPQLWIVSGGLPIGCLPKPQTFISLRLGTFLECPEQLTEITSVSGDKIGSKIALYLNMAQRKKISDYALRVPNKVLLFEAAAVWLFAGFILTYKGFNLLAGLGGINWWIAVACMCGGIGFYVLLFVRISGKHIRRIRELPRDCSCLFSFFNWKGYLMMLLMIGSGLLLRRSGIVPVIPMAYFYLFMGTPLLISAVRFLLAGLKLDFPDSCN